MKPSLTTTMTESFPVKPLLSVTMRSKRYLPTTKLVRKSNGFLSLPLRTS